MLTSVPRIAFSTLAFPDATLATAVSLGRSWGYAGVELRLVDGELIEGSMPAAARAEVKRTVAAADFFCTICKSLKVDPQKENVSPIGRPLKIVDGGKPVAKLFG